MYIHMHVCGTEKCNACPLIRRRFTCFCMFFYVHATLFDYGKSVGCLQEKSDQNIFHQHSLHEQAPSTSLNVHLLNCQAGNRDQERESLFESSSSSLMHKKIT